MKTSTNIYEQRVRSYELDPYNHLNNGAYVNWLEDGREAFLRCQDRSYKSYPKHHQAWFVVVNLDIDFISSVLAGESVSLTTRLAKTGRSSVVFRQVIRRAKDDLLRCRARVVMCFMDQDGRSIPIPKDFFDCFEVGPEGDRWTTDEGGERDTTSR